jgi:hypothetical protein
MTCAEPDALLVRSNPGATCAKEDDRAPLPTNGIEAPDDEERERTIGSSLTDRKNKRSESGGRSDDREAFLTQEIASRDQKVAELERAYRIALRDRALAVALCGRPLVAGAAAQLIRLWQDDFDVYEENGDYQISARDGRTIEQAVTDWLARPDYAHFCLPSSRGGAGPKEGHRSAARSAVDGAPRNLGEAIVLQWRKEAVTRTNDPNRPIGLGRRG